MATASKDFLVRILADAKQGIDEVSRFGQQLDDTTRSGESSFARFATNTAAVWAGVGLSKITDAAADFVQGSISAASDLNETLSASGAIFGDQAAAIEQWADTADTSFGLSKSAAMDAAMGFGDMFLQLGFTGDEASKQSQSIVQFAADLGSFRNLDTSEVLEMISASLRGEYDSLQRVIPNINAARVETEALAATGKKSASELTAQEKATATLAIIQADGSRAAGDFARTQDSAANQAKIAAAALEDQQAVLGQQLLPIWQQLQAFLIDAVIPAIGEVISWLSDNWDWLSRVATVIGVALAAYVAIRGAMAAYAAVSGIVSAAQSAWTMASYGAVGASYAQVAATNAQSIAARGAAIAQWAWNAALTANPIGLVIAAIAAVVAALVWFFTQTELGRAIWETVTAAIAAAATWLWENVLSPVFTGIGTVFTWLWENVILPIGTLIVNYYRLWGAVALWLWENVLSPVFAKIGEIFAWIWSTVIDPIVGWIAGKLELLGLGFRILYEQFVKPAFDSIGQVLSTVWQWIDANVFSPFKVGIGLIGTAFESIAGAIGTAWDGIRRAAAVPINFVLGTVWNDGLRSFWNDMVGTLGLNDMKLPRAELIKFANGTENHVAQIAPAGAMRLWAEPETGGEAYIPLAPTKRGRSTEILEAVANRFGYGLTAYADGGIWGDIASFAGDVVDNIRSAATVAGEFLSDPATAIQKHVIDGIIRPLMSSGPAGIIADTVAELPVQLVRNMVEPLEAATPDIPSGGIGWQSMWNIVRTAIPGAVMASNLRPGARTVNGTQSYHALGRAIDIVPATMAVFDQVARLFPTARELIFSPAGSRQLYNGKPHMWTGAVRAQHWDHVHLALADGGILPALAGGGVTTGPMAAFIGDNPGGQELVQPLETYRTDARELALAAAAQVNGGASTTRLSREDLDYLADRIGSTVYPLIVTGAQRTVRAAFGG